MTRLSELFGSEVDIARMANDRRERLSASMRLHDVDALVLVDPLNVEYASGSYRCESGSWAVAVVTSDEVVRTFDAPTSPVNGHRDPFVSEFVLDTWDTTAQQIADCFGSSPPGCVAVDRPTLACLRSLQVRLGHPKKTQVTDSGADVVTAARMRKTVDEIECLRRSNRVLGLVMESALSALKPGATVEDLMVPQRELLTELDPEGDILTMRGGPAAKAGRSGSFHIAPTHEAYNAAGEPPFPFPLEPDRPFEEGEVVWPDCGIGYYGCESDYGRTWIVGEDIPPSVHQREQFGHWLEVRDRVADALRPGRTAASVVTAATEAAKSLGIGQPWLSHTLLAHGIGLAPAEFPFFGYDPDGFLVASYVAPSQLRSLPHEDELELTQGMVLVLEPVVWDRDGAYRAEDTYLVTDSEPELMNRWSYTPFLDV